MRGINYAHSWFKDDADQSIPAIARTGVNTIRIVLSNGQTYYKDDAATVKHLLDLCHQNHLIAVLEVGNGTCTLYNSQMDGFWPVPWYYNSL